MARPRMRPSFRIALDCPVDRIAEALRDELADRTDEVVGTVASRQCTLAIPEQERRFWTPTLDLSYAEIESPPRTGSRLWGTFSPRAAIWTGLVFTIGTLLVASLFATMFAGAQIALGRTPTALLLPAVSAATIALLYVAALVGQGLAVADLYRLRAFVDDALRRAETAGPSTSAR